jgi:hypothetical protein
MSAREPDLLEVAEKRANKAASAAADIDVRGIRPADNACLDI